MRSFLITIDTEGDDIWSRRSSIETRNASFLPRFQSLCENYGLKPTYLVNFEMANDRGFVEFGRDLIIYCAVDPKISLTPNSDNEIAPEEILPEDFTFLLHWVLTGGKSGESLSTFRSE